MKSLRQGRANIAEAYAAAEGDELWLINANIPAYAQGNRFNHEPKRRRKLLLHRKEINRLAGAVQKGGMTVVPLRLFFNNRGMAKLVLGLARGKKLHDKRATQRDRDWQRQKARVLRENS